RARALHRGLPGAAACTGLQARGAQPPLAAVRRVPRSTADTGDHHCPSPGVGHPAGQRKHRVVASAPGRGTRFRPLPAGRRSPPSLRPPAPRHEVPADDLLPAKFARAVPYLYSEAEIERLMQAAGAISSPLKAATYQTLIALLAVTGMRIGEAIGLDRADVEL